MEDVRLKSRAQSLRVAYHYLSSQQVTKTVHLPSSAHHTLTSTLTSRPTALNSTMEEIGIEFKIEVSHGCAVREQFTALTQLGSNTLLADLREAGPLLVAAYCRRRALHHLEEARGSPRVPPVARGACRREIELIERITFVMKQGIFVRSFCEPKRR